MRFRAPSFIALAGDGDADARRARRGHDRRRRLARHRDGGVRPMSTSRRRCRRSRRSYPDSRSAVLPALRIAQERHDGWLPPEAFVEVADALELTPAYCQAVASFYDMFHLAPDRAAPGRGLHEPLVRARPARRTWSRRSSPSSASARARRPRTARSPSAPSSASAAAATRRSSPSTTATATHVRPDDVPAIVEELRAGARSVLLAGADERDLTKLAEYRAIGGYAGARRRRAR